MLFSDLILPRTFLCTTISRSARSAVLLVGRYGRIQHKPEQVWQGSSQLSHESFEIVQWSVCINNPLYTTIQIAPYFFALFIRDTCSYGIEVRINSYTVILHQTPISHENNEKSCLIFLKLYKKTQGKKISARTVKDLIDLIQT